VALTLVFQINDRNYGLEIDAVREIIEQPMRYPIPVRTPLINGVVNLHGDVLPVIDLPAMMNAAASERDGRLVVLAPACRSLALEVGRIVHIQRLDREEAIEVPDPAASAGDPFIRTVIERQEGPPVHLLDLDVIYEQLERLFADHGGSYVPASNDR